MTQLAYLVHKKWYKHIIHNTQQQTYIPRQQTQTLSCLTVYALIEESIHSPRVIKEQLELYSIFNYRKIGMDGEGAKNSWNTQESYL